MSTQTADQRADPTAIRPGWVAPTLVAITLVLWASAFVAIRHLGSDFSPGALSLGRLLVGALCLGAAALPRGLPRPSRADWLTLAAIGVLWFGVYNLALNAGERRVDAGTASMLIQVSPVLIALLAATVLHERFTAYLGLGLALAFAGVVVIALSSHDSGGGRDLVGVLLCLLAAVVYAVSLVLQKPLMQRLAAVQVTWLACTIGAVVCLPFAGDLVRETRQAPGSSIAWVVYLGAFPTAIAFTTFAAALRTVSASRLGVTTYLVPPITIVLGAVFLGETPPALAYVGGLLALVGVAVARRQPRPAVVSVTRPPGSGPGQRAH